MHCNIINHHLVPSVFHVPWSVLLDCCLKFSSPSTIAVSDPFKGYTKENLTMRLKMADKDEDEYILVWRLAKNYLEREGYILFVVARPSLTHTQWIAWRILKIGHT